MKTPGGKTPWTPRPHLPPARRGPGSAAAAGHGRQGSGGPRAEQRGRSPRTPALPSTSASEGGRQREVTRSSPRLLGKNGGAGMGFCFCPCSIQNNPSCKFVIAPPSNSVHGLEQQPSSLKTRRAFKLVRDTTSEQRRRSAGVWLFVLLSLAHRLPGSLPVPHRSPRIPDDPRLAGVPVTAAGALRDSISGYSSSAKFGRTSSSCNYCNYVIFMQARFMSADLTLLPPSSSIYTGDHFWQHQWEWVVRASASACPLQPLRGQVHMRTGSKEAPRSRSATLPPAPRFPHFWCEKKGNR